MTHPVMRAVTEENDAAEGRFAHGVRVAEALLFASHDPLAAEDIGRLMPVGVDVEAVLGELERLYRPRGVNLVRLAGKWMFRTAPDLGHLLKKESDEAKKLGSDISRSGRGRKHHTPPADARVRW